MFEGEGVATMREVDTKEAHETLDDLFDEVAKGGRIIVTRSGVPIAVI